MVKRMFMYNVYTMGSPRTAVEFTTPNGARVRSVFVLSTVTRVRSAAREAPRFVLTRYLHGAALYFGQPPPGRVLADAAARPSGPLVMWWPWSSIKNKKRRWAVIIVIVPWAYLEFGGRTRHV